MCTWYLRKPGADPNCPDSYVLYGSAPPPCPGICKICAICTEDDGMGRPIIDDDLKNQMVIALQTCEDQPRVLLRSAN